MKILIGFLGTGNYKDMTYTYEGRECKSSFPFYCLYKWFSPDATYIFTTNEGYRKHGERIKEIMNAKILIIKTPKKEEDVWEIYEKVNEIVNDDELIIDITYSFRHIPLLLYSTVLYLVEIKNASVLGVYYGAFEAKVDENVPIFNITGSLSVVKWLYAMRDIRMYGRSERIKELSNEIKIKSDDKAKYAVLSKLAGTLDNVSKNLYLNQNVKVLSSAKSLRSILEKNQKDLKEIIDGNPPLSDLIPQVKFIYNMGTEKTNLLTKQILEKILLIAEYQLDINLISESLETLREWLVSYTIWIANIHREKWLSRDVRIDAEKALGVFKEEYTKKSNADNLEKGTYYYKLKNEPHKLNISLNELGKLWDKITQIRNLAAHAGMSESGLDFNKIKSDAKEILKKYKELIEVK